MSYVLLLARQRTGTGALNSALEKHPNIKYLGEIFNPNDVNSETNFFRFYEKEIKARGKKTWPNIKAAVFQRYIKIMHERYKRKTLITDVKYNNLHHLDGNWRGLIEMPLFLQETMNCDRPIIYLKRKNRLRTFLSGVLAELNNVWHTSEKRHLRRLSVPIDTNYLCNYIDITEKEDELISNWIGHYHKKIEFDYADLFSSSGEINSQIIGSVLDLMGQPLVPGLQPSIIKQAPMDLTAAIENFEDVQRALAGTRHEWMLTD
ncbi:MAG: hypothetical protein RIS17_1332 [Pseudomonadota bacterium]|jgi:hypothetical protein